MTGLRAAVRPYRLPLVAPFTTARGTVAEREGLLVSISDGAHTGWGEAAPMPGWSAESLPEVADRLAGAVAALSALPEAGVPRVDELLGDLADTPVARAAVAGAVFDLRARQVGVGLASYLDPSAADSVAVNALVAAADPDDVAAAVSAQIADGFVTIKVKVGAAAPDVDRARVGAARAAAGADVELRLDANGAWDVPTAIAALAALAPFDIVFCEEPTRGIEAIAEVGRAGAVPVAVDESARTVDDVATALATGAIDVVVVKPQALGGPDVGRRAVRLAEEHGATAVVTTMVDSAIGGAHALHVAALSRAPAAHGLATAALLGADLALPPAVIGGRLGVPSGPGIGLAPRFAAGGSQA